MGANASRRRSLLPPITSRSLGWVLSVLVLILLVAVPLNGDDYWVRVLTGIFAVAVMAEGWNIIGGFTGYAAFGQVGWFGLGAYTVGVAMSRWGWPFWPSLIAAGLLPAVVAALIGVPILRLRGHYFAIATLAFGIALGELANNLRYVGASSGISLPIGPPFAFFYYVMLAVLVLAVVATWLIARSRLGYALVAIRENEQAAAVLGVNTALYKTAAFAISALLTGLAGGVQAYWSTSIYAPTVFDITRNVDLIVMALLGGAGTVLGPVVGAFLLDGLNEQLTGAFLQWHAVIFGAVVLLIVLFLPGGLGGLVAQGRTGVRNFLRDLKAFRV
ncbi:MAG TPA: branched-chain amino acid ABC transporter permease [Thermomicrobiaceae bacterium]|nr:branched-chain amino acid ABC transporter permease [Thermomicrobiaceae bacterium]